LPAPLGPVLGDDFYRSCSRPLCPKWFAFISQRARSNACDSDAGDNGAFQNIFHETSPFFASRYGRLIAIREYDAFRRIFLVSRAAPLYGSIFFEIVIEIAKCLGCSGVQFMNCANTESDNIEPEGCAQRLLFRTTI
jgi:hypothetical protein